MTTNYRQTFITVASDCKVQKGEQPKAGSVGALQLGLLRAKPYSLTSDELLFEVHATRHAIAAADRAAAHAAFFAKPQACLRASPLVKSFGWGLHHDAEARIAAYGIETSAYADLLGRDDVVKRPGMRSRRA